MLILPISVNLIALLARFKSTWRRRPGSPITASGTSTWMCKKSTSPATLGTGSHRLTAQAQGTTTPLTLGPRAKSPVSFARNTVFGRILSMAGRFEAVATVAVPELSLDLS